MPTLAERNAQLIRENHDLRQVITVVRCNVQLWMRKRHVASMTDLHELLDVLTRDVREADV
jgi:hypothetical protein